MSEQIVMQSKVTLSRNVKNFPFPTRMRDNRASIIAGGVYEAIGRNGGYELYKIAQISETVSSKLREQGLITDRLMNDSPYGSAIISDDKSISIMINEEDHIVEQCFEKGMNLEVAYERINRIDDEIAKKEEYCYHNKLGYLTSCPANVGTGMHASVTLFLPALTLTKSLQPCVNAVSRLNISIKSLYDESLGCYLYTLTNQRTLGLSEKEIIDLVTKAAAHVIDSEERARKMLKISSEPEMKDKAMRSYGLLKNSYKMSASEMMGLVAWAKLGAYYGYIEIDADKLDELASSLYPATIVTDSGMTFKSALDRDVYRAEMLRKNFSV